MVIEGTRVGDPAPHASTDPRHAREHREGDHAGAAQEEVAVSQRGRVHGFKLNQRCAREILFHVR